MSTYYASSLFIRQIRNKCAWLAFFWLVAALTNFGKVGDHVLDRSWWWAALHASFVIASACLFVGQVREWCKWDRALGGTR